MGKQSKKLEYSLETVESRAKFIANEESSMYGGINENGETVAVLLDKNVGMTIRTHQHNGWVREDDYLENGLSDSSTYDGRWDK